MFKYETPTSLTTLDKTGNRLWLYPQAVWGYFTKRRMIASAFLIVIYLAMPWITINGLPMIQLDVGARQFTLFGNIYWPQDVKYLAFLVIAAGISLFFFTSIAGRIWCGWACPQTVFLEFVFRKIETWLEGERNAQIAFDKAPWSMGKIARKGFKHLIFLFIAAVVANTFLAYFVGVDKVMLWMTRPPVENQTAFLFMLANLVVFYFDFAWFREQFCAVVCPYARFQSALTDEQTLQVTYDYTRGEPRGRLNKAEGDCVDCAACVRVCPTGIDIRDGSQLECIGCARCIDACNEIMDRVSKPRHLVRYDSEARLENREQHLIRPRVIIYAILLVGLIVFFFWSVSTRPLVEFNILRPPGEPYTVLENGMVSNHLTLGIVNKDKQDHPIIVKMEGLSDAKLIIPVQPFPVPANSVRRLEIFVNIDKGKMPSGKHPILIRLLSEERELAQSSVYIFGPLARK
ncbi:MAG: cytochrome c oxidase accessory protein CcoG [SAR324 cluster bacterium]|nr:cytochrome c oxidase accessory protein CcoG [SAR324 cluster bacterium]